LVSLWLLFLPAVAGGVMLHRRKTPIYPLLAFVVTIVIAVALAFGDERYRAGAEVSIVLLAAIGIDGLLRSRRPPSTRPAHEAGDVQDAPSTDDRHSSTVEVIGGARS
jgi:hypothetical protein